MRSAGHIVVSATNIKEAVHLFQEGDFDLIVLCHTLPRIDSERLTSLIRASGSRIPILCVAGVERGEYNTRADAIPDKDPVAFLRRIEDVLRKHVPTHAVGVSFPHGIYEGGSAQKQPKLRAGFDRPERTSQDRMGTIDFFKSIKERVTIH
jgi:CheY-like chemotaxis protein